jgi:hypothetical protein
MKPVIFDMPINLDDVSETFCHYGWYACSARDSRLYIETCKKAIGYLKKMYARKRSKPTSGSIGISRRPIKKKRMTVIDLESGSVAEETPKRKK